MSNDQKYIPKFDPDGFVEQIDYVLEHKEKLQSEEICSFFFDAGAYKGYLQSMVDLYDLAGIKDTPIHADLELFKDVYEELKPIANLATLAVAVKIRQEMNANPILRAMRNLGTDLHENLN